MEADGLSANDIKVQTIIPLSQGLYGEIPKIINTVILYLMKKLLVTSLTCLMMISCNQKENPLLSEFNTPFGVPPFEQIKPEHYMPAFEEGIRQHDAEIAAIIANPEAPTFKNTIEPLEFSGILLTQVNLIFSSLTEAETNDELQAIAKEISPKLTEHYDNISLNGRTFRPN